MDVVSNGLRYKGESYPEGDVVRGVPEYLAERWIKMGYAHKKEKETNEDQEKEPIEEESNPESYPKHTGGGWYELSNGEKVQGEEEAIKAQKELEGADE